MTSDSLLIDAALRSWKSTVDRSDAFFRALSDAQLEQQVAPGRNRLAYLWGHLAAVHDRMIPLLGIGDRRHPELDAAYITSPDQPGATLRPAARMEPIWTEVNDVLWKAFGGWSPADWTARHTAVSEEDFRKEPHRNRFGVLLSRTAHLASHHGQAVLTTPRD